MKTIFFLLCSLWLCSSAVAQIDETYIETLNNMLELSGSKKNFDVAVGQMMGIFKQQPQYDNVPDELWEKMEGEFKNTSMEELVQMLAPVYYEHLSLEDLEAIVQFYESPAGKKLAEKTPLITQQSMQVGQEWGRKIGEKVAAELQEKGYE
ncbi:MAG: DUF2059 domain-containing protein [Saprospiraceae bacterium]|nr:DUF2059 domain-containing protein [Lewinella sp.]